MTEQSTSKHVIENQILFTEDFELNSVFFFIFSFWLVFFCLLRIIVQVIIPSDYKSLRSAFCWKHCKIFAALCTRVVQFNNDNECNKYEKRASANHIS